MATTASVKKTSVKKSSVTVGVLAAKVLGHSRATGATALTVRGISAAFPAFNALEVAYAINELVDRELVTQKGHEEKATFLLTDRGLTGRVAVA